MEMLFSPLPRDFDRAVFVGMLAGSFGLHFCDGKNFSEGAFLSRDDLTTLMLFFDRCLTHLGSFKLSSTLIISGLILTLEHSVVVFVREEPGLMIRSWLHSTLAFFDSLEF